MFRRLTVDPIPKRTLPLAAAALALLAAAPPAAADSIRCAGGIVSTGDSKLDLLAKCGPATLVDRVEARRSQVVTSGSAAPAALAAGALAASSEAVETWTYDLGPSQFVRLVTIERGRVVRVETAGHGYTGPQERAAIRAVRCDPATIDEGDTKLELLATCGEPTVRDAWEETRGTASAAGGSAAAASVTVTVELWTYDLGPSRFIRHFRIENGRVTAVETGGYGYGR
jgi:hypothetical protein